MTLASRTSLGARCGARWAGAVVLVEVGAAAACLPDLERPPGAIASAPPPASCGDGFVDSTGERPEECDPGGAGDAGAPGCGPSCRVACEGGYLERATGHCYWRVAAALTFAGATARCAREGGHLVTFASNAELKAIVEELEGAAPDPGPFWVGLTGVVEDGGVDHYVAVADEPGFAPRGVCPGCFGNLGPSAAPEATFPPLGDASPTDVCVVSTSGPVQTTPWYRASCDAPGVHAVCEREPSGVRAEACSGALCVTVAKTLGASKRYLYVPAPATAEEAAASCAQLVGGRLVTFATNEEREGLFLALTRAGTFGAHLGFWIGLARSGSAADGGVWLWDDGFALGMGRPVPWGAGEPRATGSARAFAAWSPTGAFDTQLARAQDAPVALPYVCEYARAR